jgi:3-deoxy-D-manno-octulosonic-acid transferase
VSGSTGEILGQLYRFAGPVAAGLIYPFLALHPRGRQRLAERYGRWAPLKDEPFYWFHGASIGEMVGIEAVASELAGRFAHTERRLFTATSATALDRRSVSGERRLLPVDTVRAVRKIFRSLPRPEAFVFGETELWPVLLEELIERHIPVFLVNGRLSDYTFHRYARFRSLFAPSLSRINALTVVSAADRERFLELGARPEVTAIHGNTKYAALAAAQLSGGEREALRKKLFPSTDQCPIVTLGSVRPEEEIPWLNALRDGRHKVRLVVVPRHLEKLEYFEDSLKRFKLSWRHWSALSPSSSADVVLVDRMGELSRLYGAADLAFIGATLVDVGGHNPLEPAVHGVPVCVGPHVSVIRDIVGEMVENHAIIQLSGPEGVAGVVQRLGEDRSALSKIGDAGRSVALRHAGSVGGVVDHLVKNGFPSRVPCEP